MAKARVWAAARLPGQHVAHFSAAQWRWWPAGAMPPSEADNLRQVRWWSAGALPPSSSVNHISKATSTSTSLTTIPTTTWSSTATSSSASIHPSTSPTQRFDHVAATPPFNTFYSFQFSRNYVDLKVDMGRTPEKLTTPPGLQIKDQVAALSARRAPSLTATLTSTPTASVWAASHWVPDLQASAVGTGTSTPSARSSSPSSDGHGQPYDDPNPMDIIFDILDGEPDTLSCSELWRRSGLSSPVFEDALVQWERLGVIRTTGREGARTVSLLTRGMD
mmetsp:Transcript_95014/g.277844  ORF Transcript_95014/g.277844 Transcript_95014/m.277844 type:complete len:277 (-) Transcript_95014:130-960(-)